MARWAPTQSAVAAWLPARVLTSTGRAPTFSATTSPTAAQVAELLAQAVENVVGDVGSFDPATVVNAADVARGEAPVTLGDLAGSVAALDAACMVELTFFPDQVAEGRSPYEQLHDRYKAALARLSTAVSGLIAGRASSSLPSFRFPPAIDRSRASF